LCYAEPQEFVAGETIFSSGEEEMDVSVDPVTANPAGSQVMERIDHRARIGPRASCPRQSIATLNIGLGVRPRNVAVARYGARIQAALTFVVFDFAGLSARIQIANA